LLRNADVRGVNWGGLIAAHPEVFGSTARSLAALLAGGMPTPAVVEYDFADGARAFADLEARAVVGKPVLRVR
jgi:NADPH2:quinone reductase